MPQSRIIGGKGDDCRFGRFIHPVLEIRFLAVLVDEGVYAPFLYGILIAVEGISGCTHNLAGAGNIPQFRCQIEQAELVFNDAFVKETMNKSAIL